MLSLLDASRKLGLTPSDFVSEGPPNFFKKTFGAPGRYLLFYMEKDESKASPIWKPGYYLLPLEAADVLRVLEKNREAAYAAGDRRALPIRMEAQETPPPGVQKRLDAWVAHVQPLFFKCGCEYLNLKLDPPWGIRHRWKALLRCPRRCQPALKALI
jgi:hypothetical protein